MMDMELLRQTLEDATMAINRPDFADADPVGVVRQFTDVRDVEIAALLCSAIAWGNRRMIVRDCRRMVDDLMGGEPYAFMMERAYEGLPDERNVHRTFFCRDLKYMLRGLRHIVSLHGSVQGLVKYEQVHNPWDAAQVIGRELADANEGSPNSRCLPADLRHTALKRFNMALRWLVRRDGIVDLGVWDALTPAQLYLPLDVHVAATSRQLGLLRRKSNDRRAVEELTQELRKFDPMDPAKYDFALFGIGMGLG